MKMSSQLQHCTLALHSVFILCASLLLILYLPVNALVSVDLPTQTGDPQTFFYTDINCGRHRCDLLVVCPSYAPMDNGRVQSLTWDMGAAICEQETLQGGSWAMASITSSDIEWQLATISGQSNTGIVAGGSSMNPSTNELETDGRFWWQFGRYAGELFSSGFFPDTWTDPDIYTQWGYGYPDQYSSENAFYTFVSETVLANLNNDPAAANSLMKVSCVACERSECTVSADCDTDNSVAASGIYPNCICSCRPGYTGVKCNLIAPDTTAADTPSADDEPTNATSPSASAEQSTTNSAANNLTDSIRSISVSRSFTSSPSDSASINVTSATSSLSRNQSASRSISTNVSNSIAWGFNTSSTTTRMNATLSADDVSNVSNTPNLSDSRSTVLNKTVSQSGSHSVTLANNSFSASTSDSVNMTSDKSESGVVATSSDDYVVSESISLTGSRNVTSGSITSNDGNSSSATLANLTHSMSASINVSNTPNLSASRSTVLNKTVSQSGSHSVTLANNSFSASSSYSVNMTSDKSESGVISTSSLPPSFVTTTGSESSSFSSVSRTRSPQQSLSRTLSVQPQQSRTYQFPPELNIDSSDLPCPRADITIYSVPNSIITNVAVASYTNTTELFLSSLSADLRELSNFTLGVDQATDREVREGSLFVSFLLVSPVVSFVSRHPKTSSGSWTVVPPRISVLLGSGDGGVVGSKVAEKNSLPTLLSSPKALICVASPLTEVAGLEVSIRKRMVCRIPPVAEYYLSAKETIVFNVQTNSTTRRCAEPEWVAGTVTLSASETSIYTPLAVALVTTMTSIVAIWFVFGDTTAVEMQLMIVLLSAETMRCASEADNEAAGYVKRTVSPLAAYGPLAVVGGNTAAVLMVFVAHYLAVKVLGCLRGGSEESVRSRVKAAAKRSISRYMPSAMNSGYFTNHEPVATLTSPSEPAVGTTVRSSHEPSALTDEEEEYTSSSSYDCSTDLTTDIGTSNDSPLPRHAPVAIANKSVLSHHPNEPFASIVLAESKNCSLPSVGLRGGLPRQDCPVGDASATLYFPGFSLMVAQLLYISTAAACVELIGAMVVEDSWILKGTDNLGYLRGEALALIENSFAKSLAESRTAVVLGAILGVLYLLAVPIIKIVLILSDRTAFYDTFVWGEGDPSNVDGEEEFEDTVLVLDQRKTLPNFSGVRMTYTRRELVASKDSPIEGPFQREPQPTFRQVVNSWTTRQLVPMGRWGPQRHIRTQVGILGQHTHSHFMFPIVMTNLASIVWCVLVVAGPLWMLCDRTFIALGIVALLMCLLSIVVRPMRTRIQNALTVLAWASLAVLCAALSLVARDSSSDLYLKMKYVALCLVIGVVLMRSVHSAAVTIIEWRMAKNAAVVELERTAADQLVAALWKSVAFIHGKMLGESMKAYSQVGPSVRVSAGVDAECCTSLDEGIDNSGYKQWGSQKFNTTPPSCSGIIPRQQSNAKDENSAFECVSSTSIENDTRKVESCEDSTVAKGPETDSDAQQLQFVNGRFHANEPAYDSEYNSAHIDPPAAFKRNPAQLSTSEIESEPATHQQVLFPLNEEMWCPAATSSVDDMPSSVFCASLSLTALAEQDEDQPVVFTTENTPQHPQPATATTAMVVVEEAPLPSAASNSAAFQIGALEVFSFETRRSDFAACVRGADNIVVECHSSADNALRLSAPAPNLLRRGRSRG